MSNRDDIIGAIVFASCIAAGGVGLAIDGVAGALIGAPMPVIAWAVHDLIEHDKKARAAKEWDDAFDEHQKDRERGFVSEGGLPNNPVS